MKKIRTNPDKPGHGGGGGCEQFGRSKSCFRPVIILLKLRKMFMPHRFLHMRESWTFAYIQYAKFFA